MRESGILSCVDQTRKKKKFNHRKPSTRQNKKYQNEGKRGGRPSSTSKLYDTETFRDNRGERDPNTSPPEDLPAIARQQERSKGHEGALGKVGNNGLTHLQPKGEKSIATSTSQNQK